MTTEPLIKLFEVFLIMTILVLTPRAIFNSISEWIDQQIGAR